MYNNESQHNNVIKLYPSGRKLRTQSISLRMEISLICCQPTSSAVNGGRYASNSDSSDQWV